MSWFRRLFGGPRSSGNSSLQNCVACDSCSLEDLAEGAYRCQECGYEGGDGYAAWREQKAMERERELSTEDLKAQILNTLEQYRLALVSLDDGSSDKYAWAESQSSTHRSGPEVSVRFGAFEDQGSKSIFSQADEELDQSYEQERFSQVMRTHLHVQKVVRLIQVLSERDMMFIPLLGVAKDLEKNWLMPEDLDQGLGPCLEHLNKAQRRISSTL